jgi:nucleoid DNA-binding protein
MPVLKKQSVKAASRSAAGKPRARTTVTLKHLAANLSEAHEISTKQTEAVLGDLVKLIAAHLNRGDRIRIGGLGIFQARKRVGAMGRGRTAGEPFHVRSSKTRRANHVGSVELSAARLPENPVSETPGASAYEPSARALALLRGKEISERDLRESGGSFSLQDVESLLKISRQAIDKKVREDAIVSVPGPHGRRRYPVVQFTDDGISPGLQDVLKSLPSANGWFRLNFLITPDTHLGGRAPIDLLKEGKIDPVVRAAKAVGVQGA